MAATLLTLTSCDEYNVGTYGDEFSIKLWEDGTLGQILVNGNDQAMYFFAEDVTGESNCSGGCADTWPAVTGDVYSLELGAGLDKADFGSIDAGYDEKQITYKGWPLYYFSPDGDGELEATKETLGEGKGGVFHVAKPDYSILLAKQSVVAGEDKVVYLVNDRGVSIYYNSADEDNKSNCSGGCASVWTPVSKNEIVVPSSLDEYDFAKIDRDDDLGPQVARKGRPLYYFDQDDNKPGIVLGEAGGPNKTFFTEKVK